MALQPSRHFRRGALASLTIGSMLLASLATASTVAASQIVFVAELTGAAEVPDPGDPDGIGQAQISVSPAEGIVCWTLTIEGTDAATAAHVHVGDAGVAGAVVVPIGTPDGNGESQDCSSGHDPVALQSIADDPEGHYVNIHTGAFSDGALRGQLSATEITNIVVGAYACPAGIDSPESLEAAGGRFVCSPVALPDAFPPLEDGYTWDPEPIETDLDIELDLPDGRTLDLADSAASGGGSCNTVTLVCAPGRDYTWDSVSAGETTVTQVTLPAGYVFGWAAVMSDSNNGDAPPVIGTQGRSVTFDTASLDRGAYVYFVAIVAGAGPTPTPGVGPTNRPTLTPPPTDTASAPTGSDEGTLVALGLVTFSALAAAGLLARRRSRALRAA
jgi:hypothetical protein